MAQEVGNPSSFDGEQNIEQFDNDSYVKFPETEYEERARIGKYFDTTYPDGRLPAVQIKPVQE